MRIVDSHCHAALGWYEPIEVLLAQMDRYGVEQAALIQINGQSDNSYQAACVQRYPDRLRSVVIVDVTQDDAPRELERLVAEGATGVRLPPGARSPGDDPLTIWRKAAELGITVSCGGSREAFADTAFADVFAACPTLPIVIEHLGSLKWTDLPADGSRPPMFDLARFPNAYVKIHGLGEFSQRAMPVREPFAFVEPLAPFLEMAYDAFGPARIMWGSDYPPVSSREGYGNALRLTMARFVDRPEAERAQMFGGVAGRLFGFDR
ncbi:MAG: amidohydrolase family protein [Chloroflexi bacterium]|nr:amidohydrolase family protein [Chloroflexota bacterium]